MTQEEKAKAYDEALTIAKRIISKNCSEVEKLCLKSIFPELAESEDEKMINELQGFLDSFGADYFGTGKWQKFHDWLEKQKESLHISETCKENPNSFTNEDERIRKFLVDYAIEMIAGLESDISLSTYDGIKGHDPEAEAELAQWQKARAYLEKQKYDRMQPIYDNQESFESALDKAWKSYNDSGARTVDGCEDNYTECAYAKGFREGYLFGLEKQKNLDKMIVVSPEVWDNAISDAYENGKKDEEKQKEQKPVEKQDYSGLNDLERVIHRGFLAAGVENVPVTIIKETAQECLTNIKPAEWSEKMKQTTKNTHPEEYPSSLAECISPREYGLFKQLQQDCIETIEQELYSLGKEYEKDYDPRIKFLKSLRPQQKVEWSEEDENGMFSDIIMAIRAYYKCEREDLVDYVKSLRPQPHWKPTEEQMEWLKSAVRLSTNKPHIHGIIISLYEQLKRL